MQIKYSVIKNKMILKNTLNSRVIRKITNISYYNIVREYVLYTPFVAFFIKTYFWNFQNGGFGGKNLI